MYDAHIASPLKAFSTASALALILLVSGCKKPASTVDDASLTTSVQQRISGDGAISSEPIQTSVQNGIVTLNGQVSNEAARTLAANDAAAVTGVAKVINNLLVAPAAPVAANTPAPEPPAVVPAPAHVAPRKVKAKPTPSIPAPAPIVREQAQDQPIASPPPPPPPPPKPAGPVFKTVTLASGSTIPVRITQTLDSASTQTGDSFSGSIASDIIQDGMVVLPRGAQVNGHVIEAKDATHFSGSSALSIELTGVNARGEHIDITTEPYSKQGTGRGKNTAVKTGIGAAAGAVLGGIFGGGKGAAIGAAAGGGTGAGINAVTKGQQVQIPSESVVRFRLTNSIAVRTSTPAGAGANSVDPGLQNHDQQ